MEWFKEDWLKEDHKALGVYLALLIARFTFPLSYQESVLRDRYYAGERKDIANTVYLFYRGKELKEAMETIDEFIAEFIKNTPSNFGKRKRILEELEEKYYDRFKDVYQKLVKKSVLADMDIQKLQNFLWNLKAKLYKISDFTPSGSIWIYYYSDDNKSLIKRYENLNNDEIDLLINKIRESHISVPLGMTDIFPAPILEDVFIESLGGLEEKLRKEEVAKMRSQEKLNRITIEFNRMPLETTIRVGEKLEECVINVFRYLGFNASKAKVKGRSGVEHEIDVLAQKDLEGLTFKIGVECKNWKNTVGKDIVERYIIRWLDCGLNMYIIIAKSFTEDAKRMAKAWGLMPIALGEQAKEDNLEEITKILLRKFSGLVIGIAKQPLIDSILGRINEIENELNQLGERLNDLRSGLNELSNEVKKLLM